MPASISITGPADAPGLRAYRGLSVRTASGLYDVALPAAMPAAEAATVAALLAAAPDMLAALVNLVDLCEHVFVKPFENDDLTAARTAIALAEAGH